MNLFKWQIYVVIKSRVGPIKDCLTGSLGTAGIGLLQIR